MSTRERNRRGLIKEQDLIAQILKDLDGCIRFQVAETPQLVTINIKKAFKDDMLYIEYTVDYKLYKNLKPKLEGNQNGKK